MLQPGTPTSVSISDGERSCSSAALRRPDADQRADSLRDCGRECHAWSISAGGRQLASADITVAAVRTGIVHGGSGPRGRPQCGRQRAMPPPRRRRPAAEIAVYPDGTGRGQSRGRDGRSGNRPSRVTGNHSRHHRRTNGAGGFRGPGARIHGLVPGEPDRAATGAAATIRCRSPPAARLPTRRSSACNESLCLPVCSPCLWPRRSTSSRISTTTPAPARTAAKPCSRRST